MAANVQKLDLVDIDLTSGTIHRSWIKQSIGSADVKGNAFGVRVFRDGEPVTLSSVSVYGYFRDPHGTNIAITSGNSVSGNVAYVVLPAACYNYEIGTKLLLTQLRRLLFSALVLSFVYCFEYSVDSSTAWLTIPSPASSVSFTPVMDLFTTLNPETLLAVRSLTLLSFSAVTFSRMQSYSSSFTVTVTSSPIRSSVTIT